MTDTIMWYMLYTPFHPFECQPHRLPGYWCYICGHAVGDRDEDVCLNEKCLEYQEAFFTLCRLAEDVSTPEMKFTKWNRLPWESWRKQIYPLPETEPFDFEPKGDEYEYQTLWEGYAYWAQEEG